MTTTADVAIRNGHGTAALAIRPGQEMFSDKQRAALAVLGIKDATNADLAVFMHYCQKTGLDPFSKQIYMIARREKQGSDWVTKQTIQVGIDGFRVIRDRIEQRGGVTVEYKDTIWYDADGGRHEIWLWDEPPAGCNVTVLKNGRPFPGTLRFSEYVQTRNGEPTGKWRDAPAHQIEKCAEAFALRRAFPNDLGGIYLEDEIPEAPPAMPARPQRVTAAEIIHEAPAAEAAVAKPPPPQDRPQPVPRATVSKLDKLLGQLPLGTEEDVRALLEWQCGGPYTAARGQVRLVTGFLEDHLRQADGDPAEAASEIWRQWRAVHAQDAAEATQEELPEGDGG